MAKRKPNAAPATPKTDAERAWDDFLAALPKVVDAAKLSKAMTMLRSDRFRLYAEVQSHFVAGIVRSQKSATRVYSCRLFATGRYWCCTQNLIQCVVSGRSPCKHLLVLVVGLVKAGDLEAALALEWLQHSRAMGRSSDGHRPDKDMVAAEFLRFKGVEAGEVDWRPTETIPEDFYAM